MNNNYHVCTSCTANSSTVRRINEFVPVLPSFQNSHHAVIHFVRSFQGSVTRILKSLIMLFVIESTFQNCNAIILKRILQESSWKFDWVMAYVFLCFRNFNVESNHGKILYRTEVTSTPSNQWEEGSHPPPEILIFLLKYFAHTKDRWG